MNRANDTSLVIFTSEGREHLIKQTIPSFLNACSFQFSAIIIAIDGQYNLQELERYDYDHLIYHPKRIGYVNSLIQALKAIDTPYFFLLEDDFLFKQAVPLDKMLNHLKADDGWGAVFLSRSAPLTEADKVGYYSDDLFKPEYGLSISPALFNTKHLRSAFKSLVDEPKNEVTAFVGFEPYVENYFTQNDIKFAVIDPGQTAHVDHIGYLESTAREYHMINSVDEKFTDVNKRYLSGFGKESTLTLYNKLAMLPKLWLAVVVMSFKIFNVRQAYDTAFRLYISYPRKFKY